MNCLNYIRTLSPSSLKCMSDCSIDDTFIVNAAGIVVVKKIEIVIKVIDPI